MTLQGFDASSFQTVSSWAKVAKSAYGGFDIARAVMGATGRDTSFQAHVKAAEAAGIPTLAYGFAYPQSSSATAEADALVSAANSVGGIHSLVIDIEGAGVPSGVSVAELDSFLSEWIARIKSHGYVPIVYLNRDFLEHRITASKFTGEILWQAEYTSAPTIISGWHPTFWQYTSGGRVPGISGRVDLDVFFGSAQDLQTLLNGGHYVATLLQVGSTGAAVKSLQENLNLVLGIKLVTDGDYGPATAATVKSFQQIYHLSVDGIAGPNTLSKLADEVNAKEAADSKPAPEPPKSATLPSDPAPASNLAQDLASAQAALNKALQDANTASAAQIQQLTTENQSLTQQLAAEKQKVSGLKSDVSAALAKYN